MHVDKTCVDNSETNTKPINFQITKVINYIVLIIISYIKTNV